MTRDEVKNELYKASEKACEAYNNALKAVKEAGIVPPVVHYGGGVCSGVTDAYDYDYEAVFFGETKEEYEKAEAIHCKWLDKLARMR